MKNILLLNPNSSEEVTEGLRNVVASANNEEVTIATESAPKEAPKSINDTATGVQSAVECYKRDYSNYDGVIVACFSQHSLIPMLKEKYRFKQIIGVLEASITAALLSPAKKFGFVTTSTHWIDEFENAVRDTVGASSSERYVGTTCSDFEVVELRTAKEASVNAKLIQCAQELVDRGARTIILGCAGMAGKSAFIKQQLQEITNQRVDVIDGIGVAVDQMKMLVKLL